MLCSSAAPLPTTPVAISSSVRAQREHLSQQHLFDHACRMLLGTGLKGLVSLVFTKCENKMTATFRSSDEHGVDWRGPTVWDSPRRERGLATTWEQLGSYACAAAVAGRVN